LGGVVAVANASGTLVSQTCYMPFGEVRTDVGTITQTDFGYTGQRNLDAQGNSFTTGLVNFKARMFDPMLGRFIQPDTITPGGPQGLNRYSYGLNNPVKYSDPSGHTPECVMGGPNGCMWWAGLTGSNAAAGVDPNSNDWDANLAMYGITFSGPSWDSAHEADVVNAVEAVGNKFSRKFETAAKAFQRIFGSMNFIWGHYGDPPNGQQKVVELHGWCDGCRGGWSEPSNPGVVAFYTKQGYTGDQFSALVTHELGHKFIYNYGYDGINGSFNDKRNEILNGPEVMVDGEALASTWRHASSDDWSETLPDFFTAWVFNEWNPYSINANSVADAISAMNARMSGFR
jgi:RHS repeat-associated protein